MEMTYVLIGLAVILAIGGGVFYYRNKKKKLDVLFNQVFESSLQIPKQKRQSFLLLMFHEGFLSSKNKKNAETSPGWMTNPKQLELKLLKMSTILKDRSKVKDKNMKHSLRLLDTYQVWEKDKITKSKNVA